MKGLARSLEDEIEGERDLEFRPMLAESFSLEATALIVRQPSNAHPEAACCSASEEKVLSAQVLFDLGVSADKPVCWL